MNGLSCVVGEILPVEILHFGSDFSFIPEASVPAYGKIIFCHLKVKGALSLFSCPDSIPLIVLAAAQV